MRIFFYFVSACVFTLFLFGGRSNYSIPSGMPIIVSLPPVQTVLPSVFGWPLVLSGSVFLYPIGHT